MKRYCSKCGKVMDEGYVIENGLEYYCSDKCLYSKYSLKEYVKLYANGYGDSYWTQWHD